MDELMDERRYWLALTVCDGIGPVRLLQLLRYFGSAKKAWNAPKGELQAAGLGKKIATDIETFRKKFSLQTYEEKLEKLRISYLTLQDTTYPHLLKQIKNPPSILYKKGTYLFNRKDNLLSVVGTRRITEYGREVTEKIVSELVVARCVIVSGLAMGVDAVAHEATLKAKGNTIAVLGSGVDFCTPAENQRLYDAIIANGGAIISEYPLGMAPNKGSFPARNRIIAGLSQGVLVTEGAFDSGSLITANDAMEYHRKVFAVPGPITSSVSTGPIALISKGATIVTSAKDILKALEIKNSGTIKSDNASFKRMTKEETIIIELLQDQNLHFNELLKRTGYASAQLGALVSLMEVKGLIKNNEGFFGIKWDG